MSWIVSVVTATVLAILLAGFMIPQILLISFRKKLFDVPDGRKIHTSLVPRLGGIAFVPVIGFSIVLLLGIDLAMGRTALFAQVLANAKTIAFCFCALLMLYVVGLADDLVGVKYRAKFVVQVCCVAMLVVGGLGVADFHGFLGLEEIPWWGMWPFTLLLGIFIINAINLIDGIDGLASGLSSVAMVVYGVAFYLGGEYLYSILSFATLGVLLPFFYYNVFGNPEKQKKIFMGDTGSLSIGIILCILGFKMMQVPAPPKLAGVNMLMVAMSPLVVPCFDVVRVYMTRIRTGHNPFLPDKNHIHHKLLNMGMSQHRAMLTIVGASLLFTVFNVALSVWVNVNLVIVVDALVFTLGTGLVARYVRKRRRRIIKQTEPIMIGKTSQREVETWNVIKYLEDHGGQVSLDEIRAKVEVESLRVIPIVMDLQQKGYLEISQTNNWGGPTAVRRRDDSNPTLLRSI